MHLAELKKQIAELKKQIAEQAKLNQSQTNRALKALVTTLADALAQGDKVTLSGLGTFSITRRKARSGIHPGSGKRILIPAANRVRFKSTKALQQRLNPDQKPVRILEQSSHEPSKRRHPDPNDAQTSTSPQDERRSTPRVPVAPGSILLYGVDGQGGELKVDALNISERGVQIMAPDRAVKRFTRRTCPLFDISLVSKETKLVNRKVAGHQEVIVILNAFEDDIGDLMQWMDLIRRLKKKNV